MNFHLQVSIRLQYIYMHMSKFLIHFFQKNRIFLTPLVLGKLRFKSSIQPCLYIIPMGLSHAALFFPQNYRISTKKAPKGGFIYICSVYHF